MEKNILSCRQSQSGDDFKPISNSKVKKLFKSFGYGNDHFHKIVSSLENREWSYRMVGDQQYILTKDNN